ncbi:TIGR02587 family membrane protein [Brucella pseudogrignonensis]|uniref:TIGR02587 family membrane protein n=1 Tax=Brucella pseudogrignonensis TaxID=419475 RepID=UPI00124CF866|nr:TIGR02587 family membrane protein [Brucella pseudogrignonensis]KAB2689248.1 TIGR02587 family membrane protein [Brucella pseudogrignonensis]
MRSTSRFGSSNIHPDFFTGIARGLGGALLFALPMLMTMEMWELGLYANPSRLLLLCVLNIPLLIGLAYRIGFERMSTWTQMLRDAAIAFALGIVLSSMILWLFGLLSADLPLKHNIAMIALQAVPASIGALLGRSQLGMRSEQNDEDDGEYDGESGYFNELFMMVVGALFLGLNVAPTEEMILIAYKIVPVQTALIVLLSIALMHGFVYSIHFKGGHRAKEGAPWWSSLIRFTLPGYALAFATSAYTLWTFERLDDGSFAQMVTTIVVLSFPAAIGAASARLVL